MQMGEATRTSFEGSNHIQSPDCKWLDEWNSLQGRCGLVGHVGVELATCALVNYIFRHLIFSRLIESRWVCFDHDGPRGCMVTTGPRVDIIKDYLTFLWRYAFLTNSSRALSIQLSFDNGKGFGSTDDLSILFFVLRKFFPQDIRDVWHRPVGSDCQDLHD